MIEFVTHVHPGAVPHLKCLLWSLGRSEPEFRLWILPWDGAEAALRRHIGQSHRLLSIETFELECVDLGIDWGRLRGTRSGRDLAWTAQACIPYWFMRTFPQSEFVYVDNDCFFFQPIGPILRAMPSTAHVGVCRHHYPAGKENLSAGIYNNGLIWWRHSAISEQHAKWWALETIERWQPGHPLEVPHEQKLLDEWPEQLGSALVELPRECDVGPWRLAEIVDGKSGPMLGATPLQSYHFHETRAGHGLNPLSLKGGPWNLTNYPIADNTRQSVYLPYVKLLESFL